MVLRDMKNIKVTAESTPMTIVRYGSEEQIIGLIKKSAYSLQIQNAIVKRAEQLGSNKIFKELISKERLRIGTAKKIIEIKGWEFFLNNLNNFYYGVSGINASIFSPENRDEVVKVLERCDLPVEALITIAQQYPELSWFVAEKIKAKISK